MQAGAAVELHVYPGTYHGSFIASPNAGVSLRHLGDIHNFLNRQYREGE